MTPTHDQFYTKNRPSRSSGPETSQLRISRHQQSHATTRIPRGPLLRSFGEPSVHPHRKAPEAQGSFFPPVPRRPHPRLPGPRPHFGRLFPPPHPGGIYFALRFVRGFPAYASLVVFILCLGHDSFACSYTSRSACFRCSRALAEDVRLRRSAANRSFA